MMRAIKFRGKLLENGNWVSGNLILTNDNHAIIQPWIRTEGIGYTHPNAGEVDIDSVGQFTGVYDGTISLLENGEEDETFKGVEVWEHDILKIPCTNKDIHGEWALYEVIYRNGSWITEYLISEKGQILPYRYAGADLLSHTDYTTKDIIEFDRDIRLYDINVVGNIIDSKHLFDGNERYKKDIREIKQFLINLDTKANQL